MEELIAVNGVNAVELFANGRMDPLLEKICEEAKKAVPDTSTNKGRREIASLANKVAKTKTYLDRLGKDLNSEHRKKIEMVDAERRKVRKTLDELKQEVRSPLTEWEQKEEERVNGIKYRLKDISSLAEGISNFNSGDLSDRLAELKTISVTEESFMEFFEEAEKTKANAAEILTVAHERQKKYEDEQAELERLRKAEEERKKKEEADRIKREEEERQKREEEEKRKREAEEEHRKKEEKERLEKEYRERVEREKKEAEERAEQQRKQAELEKKQAVEAERKRIEKEREDEERRKEQRRQNEEHKRRIHQSAEGGLIALGIDADDAQRIVNAISNDQIAYLKIEY